MSSDAELGFFTQPGVLPAGSVDNSELANMAANSVKANATASSAAPTDLQVFASQVVGRASTGNLTVLTAVQLGQIFRRETFVVDSTSSGTVATYAVAETTTHVNFKVNVNVDVHGMTADATTFGKTVTFQVDRGFTGTVTFFDDSASAGAALQRLRNPGSVAISIRAGESVTYDYWDSRWRLVSLTRLVDPAYTAPILNNLANTFVVYVSCPSGGAAGTADDVTVWNANAPFALRILDATLRVSTAVGGSTAALRTASGGGGSVVLPDPAAGTQTFSTATTGPHDDVAVATATVAANGSLFLRRSDRSAVGELILTCIRT